MTFPITPFPSLHFDPTAAEDFAKQLQAEERALQQMFSSILPGILKQIVQALVPGSEGIIDELTTWEQDLMTGDWMRQFGSALTGIAEPGIKDLENWANSVRKFGKNLSIKDFIDLPDLFTLPVSHVGKPVTSPNLLTNSDFSEHVPAQGSWNWDGPQLYCFSVGGTGEPTGTGNTAQVGSALNPAYWNWIPVSYSAALYPMASSISDGIEQLVAAIETVPIGTKIALIGVSQGAVVTSQTWENEFVSSSGRLHARMNDVVGAVTFGNPRRKAGSHAVGTPDPGGHGIAASNLQTNVPSWWYDYADPDDIVPTVPTGSGGDYASVLYDFLTNTWNGVSETLLSDVLSTFKNPLGNVSSVVKLLEMIAGDAWKSFTGNNPHTSYNVVKIDGTSTSVQLAVSYLDSVGATNVGVQGTNFQNNSGGSGSVTVYANGTVEEWLHPDVITVTPEQTLNVSAWAKAAGLTATGSPIIVGLTTFLAGSVVSKVDLGSIAGSTSWTQITGSAYTVPTGVDSVQLRLKVNSTATAGQVWFDDLSLTKTGLLPTSHVTGLNTLIQNLFGSLNIGSVLQDLAIPNITLAMSNDMQGIIDNIANAMGHTGTGHTLANLLTYLQAIPQSVVSGLTSALSAKALQTDFQSLIDNIANAMGHSGTGHTIANILTYLEAIPASVINGVLSSLNIPNITKAMSTDLLKVFNLQAVRNAAGPNMATDPTCSNAAMWPTTVSGGLLSISTAQFRSSPSSLKNVISATQFGSFPLLYDTGPTTVNIPVVAGRTYYAEYWIRADAANVGSTLQWMLQFQCSDSTGVHTLLQTNKGILTPNSSGWQKVSGYYTIPASGYDRLIIVATYGSGGTVSDAYYFDDISIYEATEAQNIVKSLFGTIGADLTGAIQASVIPDITLAMSSGLQGLVDNIANAMGHSGTGHTLANILTYLEAIPQSVVTNLTSDLSARALQTDFQSLIDNIANAMGHSGTGHTIANILTYLEAIPASVINGVLNSLNIPNITLAMSTDMQGIIDNIANAMGQSGTGHTLANLVTYLENIPQSVVSGLTSALSSKALQTDFQSLIDNIANAMGQSGTGHTIANILTYLEAIPQSVVSGLTSALSSKALQTDFQSLIDNIANAMGQAGTGHTIANILTYLENIPQSVVSGLTSALSARALQTDFQSLIDNIANAMGQSGTGHTIANILTYLEAIPQSVVTGLTSALSARALQTDFQSLIDNIANAMGHSGTGHTIANILTYLEAIPASVVNGVLNAVNIPNITKAMSTDLQSFITNVFGTTSIGTVIQQPAIPDILRSMSQDLQAVIDGIHQAVNGGGSTGNTPDTVKTNLQKIPFINLELLANPSSATSVTLDAVGAGNQENNTNSFVTASTNWSHTIGASADMLVVTCVWESGTISNVGGTAGFNRTVTCGSTAMTSILVSKGTSSFTEIFVLANPPTGVQTITATMHASSNYLGGNTCDGVAGESVSLIGVGELGATSTASGSGTAMSQSITANANAYIVQGFATERPSSATGASITSYNQTSDYYSGNYVQGIKNVGGVNLPTGGAFLAGHAPGAATVNFTATDAGSGDNWYGIAVAFLPSPQAPIGSGVVQSRTSTTGFNLAAGYNVAPTGFWDTQLDLTGDMTWNSSTGIVTIGSTGWYYVTVSFDGNGGTPGSQVRTRAVVYRNGVVAAVNGSGDISNSSTGFLGTGFSTSIYCSAGDTLQAGYWSNVASTSCQLVGESTNTISLFKVVLANRSLA